MYIELVRRVMEDAIALHVVETQRPNDEVLRVPPDFLFTLRSAVPCS